MLIFSQVTILIKMWAKCRGIYNYNLGYLNGISIMILVAKAMQTFYSENGANHVKALLTSHFTYFRQIIIEHFFNLYADWPWDDPCFKDRAVWLVDYDKYIMDNELRCTNSISELQSFEFLQVQYQLSHQALIPILSPFPPFKCTTSQMSISCKSKILKEFEIARR